MISQDCRCYLVALTHEQLEFFNFGAFVFKGARNCGTDLFGVSFFEWFYIHVTIGPNVTLFVDFLSSLDEFRDSNSN